MRYRHFLFLGLVGAVSLVACKDGDDDDDDAADAGADAAPVHDGGVTPGVDATVPDGGTKPTDAGPTADGGTDAAPVQDGGPLTIPARCNGSVPSVNNPASPSPPGAPALGLADGFQLVNIATVSDGPRQLVALPNGDLLIGTNNGNVDIITNADGAASTTPSAPTVFATFTDSPAQGITYDPTTCTIYVGTQHAIYAIPYVDAQVKGVVGQPIANIRTIPPDAGHNDDIHVTTSLAVVPGGKLYAGIGSDCNACVEVDPTRATVQEMNLDGSGLTTRATRVRNAIGLAINPATGVLWAGGAGQDGLPTGHPYEYFDAVGLHTGVPDYGWPDCEENQVAYVTGSNCSGTVIPLIETPAYQTIIGAVFYPTFTGKAPVYDFGATYHGSVFLTGHGSWHETNGIYITPPRVMFVPMTGDAPTTVVDFNDVTTQWTEFLYGFQNMGTGVRVGKPTGIAVGPQGTLFIADDDNNDIYQIRPHLN